MLQSPFVQLVEMNYQMTQSFGRGGFLVVHNLDAGKVLAISSFETEEDLKQGDTTLNAMDPPVQQGTGKRSSVEVYEVGVKIDN